MPDINELTGRDIVLPGHRDADAAGRQDTTDALQLQYDLARGLSDSPIVFGNTVTLLPGGAQAFEAMFRALGAARESVNLEYFILADIGSGGTHLSEILLDRLGEGVKVKIIYDFVRAARHASGILRHLAQGRRQGDRVQPDRPAQGAHRLGA